MGLVEQLLAAWHEVGVTVIIASHATERLEPFLHGRVVLERGLVAEVSGEAVSSVPPSLATLPRPAVVTR